jgi:hypothetical protein
MTTRELSCLVATSSILDVYKANFFPIHCELLKRQTDEMTLRINTVAQNGIRRPRGTVTLPTHSQQAPQERAAGEFEMRPWATESFGVFD